jgi:hypothetical protein
MYNATKKFSGYLQWYNVPRYTNEEKIKYRKSIFEYNVNLSLEEKIHICNVLLPEPLYEILVRKDCEVYAFDTMNMCLYGDETEYPLEVIVNNIIHTPS